MDEAEPQCAAPLCGVTSVQQLLMGLLPLKWISDLAVQGVNPWREQWLNNAVARHFYG